MKNVIVLLFLVLILTGCTSKTDINRKENNIESNEDNVVDNTIEDNKENNNNNIDNESENDNNIDDIIDNIEDINKKEEKDELIDTTNIKTEEDVVNYFVELKENVKEKINSDTWENVKETVMDALDTAYGFCFKGEEIGGYTLNELSESAKDKILNIVLDIDEFIESKSPGYKELFKESYDNMIESAKEGLGLIKDKISEFFSNDNE